MANIGIKEIFEILIKNYKIKYRIVYRNNKLKYKLI